MFWKDGQCHKGHERFIQAPVDKKPGYAWAKSSSGQMKLGLQIPTSIDWGMRTTIQSICALIDRFENIDTWA